MFNGNILYWNSKSSFPNPVSIDIGTTITIENTDLADHIVIISPQDPTKPWYIGEIKVSQQESLTFSESKFTAGQSYTLVDKQAPFNKITFKFNGIPTTMNISTKINQNLCTPFSFSGSASLTTAKFYTSSICSYYSDSSCSTSVTSLSSAGDTRTGYIMCTTLSSSTFVGVYESGKLSGLAYKEISVVLIPPVISVPANVSINTCTSGTTVSSLSATDSITVSSESSNCVFYSDSACNNAVVFPLATSSPSVDFTVICSNENYNQSATVVGTTGTNSKTFRAYGKLRFSANTTIDASCYNTTTGSINVKVNGGAATAYYYSLSPSIHSGTSNTILVNLPAGSYSLSVTNGNEVISADFDISQPEPLKISLAKVDVLCNGASTGSINATITGGTSPYTYNWPGILKTTSQVSGLSAATYQVIVKDRNLCSTQAQIEINQPATAISLNPSQTNVKCNGGSTATAQIVAQGGVGPYTYLWSNGDINSNTSGLSFGPANVTVTDSNQCQKVQPFSITEPTKLTVSAVPTDALCYGGTGSATASASGGTGSYSFLWSNNHVGQSAAELTQNNYTVQVTDANQCVSVSASIRVNVPDAVNAVASITQPKCKTDLGSISVTASGGSGIYYYSWSTGSTLSSVSGLQANNYTLNILDSNYCPFSDTYTIYTPIPFTLTSTFVNTKCFGDVGSATAIPAGGAAPYKYSWFPVGGSNANATNLAAGTYVVTSTDDCSVSQTSTVVLSQPTDMVVFVEKTNVACNGGDDGEANVLVQGGVEPYTFLWSNGDIQQSTSNLSANKYNVTVTDSNQCKRSSSVTVTQPPPLQAQMIPVDVGCPGSKTGSVSISVTGGTGKYLYSWLQIPGSSNQIKQLEGGNYTAVVTDSHFCTISKTAEVYEPRPISITLSKVNVGCYGEGSGSAAVSNVTGGRGGYTYMWSTGETASAVFNLTAGNYSVSVSDSFGCLQTQSFIISQPEPLALTPSQQNAMCFNTSTGSAIVSVTGGTSFYSYVWSPNVGTGSAVYNLSSGVYVVTVSDSNGCSLDYTFNITEPGEYCQNNGTCTGLYTCECALGWNGTDCSIPVCDECLNGGNCSAPGQCTCAAGFKGKACENAIVLSEIASDGNDNNNERKVGLGVGLGLGIPVAAAAAAGGVMFYRKNKRTDTSSL